MDKVKYILIFVCLLLLLLSNKCDKENNTVIQKELPFVVAEAYCQKMIPGTKKETPYLEFNLIINNQQTVSLDSIYFRGVKSVLSTWKGKNKTIISAKINKKGAIITNNLIKGLKNNQAIIISTLIKNKSYFFIDSIKEKEPVYLP